MRTIKNSFDYQLVVKNATTSLTDYLTLVEFLDNFYEKALYLLVKTNILKITIGQLSSWDADRNVRMLELINLKNWNCNSDNLHPAVGNSKVKYTFLPIEVLL